MSSNQAVNLQRALGGEVNRIFNDRMDADLRGIVTSEEYLLFLELKDRLEKKGLSDLMKHRLEVMERRIYAEQYDKMGRELRDDISKMARVVGHSEVTTKANPFDIALG